MQPRVLMYDVKGEGEPLVLLPGGLTGWISWIPHQERLASRYTVVRVQPIHNELGSTGQTGDRSYTAEIERESLKLTLDALGLDAPHMAGWSRGGAALLDFALVHPQRVRSMTLVEPGTYWLLAQSGALDDELRAMNAFMRERVGQEFTEDDLARFLALAGLIPPGEDPRQHPSWAQWTSHRMALSWPFEDDDRSQRSIAELAGLTIPALLVKGTATSRWLKRGVDILADRLPEASVLALDGGHACHIQRLDQFLAAFEQHLRSADKTAHPTT